MGYKNKIISSSLPSIAALWMALGACSQTGSVLQKSTGGGAGGGGGVGGTSSAGTGGLRSGTGGGIGSGTGGGIGTGGSRADAGPDGGGACPAQLPIGGGACGGSATCNYAPTSCCGFSSFTYTCQCQNGSFSCLLNECNFVCPDAGSAVDGAVQPGTGGATGSTGGSSGSDAGGDARACTVAADCGPNPGAACATVCADGSNPCAYACVNSQCVARGCPGDAGAQSPHSQGQSCDDGLGCTAGLVCKAIGDPCATYPNCKVCYLPCQADGGCPGNYSCAPVSGQGGDVCI